METTKTTTTESGATISVTVERSVRNVTINADGHIIETGRKEANEFVSIRITPKGGKERFSRSLPQKFNDREIGKIGDPRVYACCGDAYIGEAAYNQIMDLYAAATKDADTEEHRAVKAVEKKKEEKAASETAKIELIEQGRKNNPGWCDKCQSYCYGDCEAN